MDHAGAPMGEFQRPRAPGAREVSGAALAVAGQGIVVLLAFSADVPLSAVILVHAGVVALMSYILLSGRRGEEDRALAITILLLNAIGGPAGALATLAALPFAGNVASTRDVRRDWYERLARAGRPSHVTQLYERIISGRTQRLDMQPPRDFLKVIAQGTLDERQRALGLVARHFHPDYTPVLDAALRSGEPVVRVQAAAVVARVREDLKERIEQWLVSSPRTLRQTLHDAGELHALSTCSLLSPQLRARCTENVRALLDDVLARGRDVTRFAREVDKDALDAMERYLIGEGRFKELRVLHRVTRALSGAKRRVRRRLCRERA